MALPVLCVTAFVFWRGITPLWAVSLGVRTLPNDCAGSHTPRPCQAASPLACISFCSVLDRSTMALVVPCSWGRWCAQHMACYIASTSRAPDEEKPERTLPML